MKISAVFLKCWYLTGIANELWAVILFPDSEYAYFLCWHNSGGNEMKKEHRNIRSISLIHMPDGTCSWLVCGKFNAAAAQMLLIFELLRGVAQCLCKDGPLLLENSSDCSPGHSVCSPCMVCLVSLKVFANPTVKYGIRQELVCPRKLVLVLLWTFQLFCFNLSPRELSSKCNVYFDVKRKRQLC